jgi:hypothetical protein
MKFIQYNYQLNNIKMAGQKIVYILGAGASALTLPILSNLGEEMSKMQALINQYSARSHPGVSYFRDQLDNLRRMSKGYNTVDTYAKKLFLNKDSKKLHELKVTLSFFFTLRQFAPESRGIAKLSPKIDKRYISLASSFLEEKDGQICLPDNIKFLSWNYDLQLEMALRDFHYEEMRVSECLQRFKVSRDISSINGKEQIIHLNGVAGLYFENGETTCIVDSLSSSSFDTSIDELKDLFLKLYNSEDHNIMQFNFAWESNIEKNMFSEKMLKALAGVSYAVIIGYSFPVFNRKFDKDIFTALRQVGLRKVYYQVKRPDPDALKATFNLSHADIVPFDVDNDDTPFVLPFEF